MSGSGDRYNLHGSMTYRSNNGQVLILVNPDRDEVVIEIQSDSIARTTLSIEEADRVRSLLDFAVTNAKERPKES